MTGMHDITGDFLTCDVEGGCRVTKYVGCAQKVAIPESIGGKRVISLDGEAFNGCPVTEIRIPESIRKIEAFGKLFYCDQLENFQVAPENPQYFSVDGVLYRKEGLIRFPQAHPSEDYAVLEGTTVIGNRAFSHCKKLKNLTIPESVREVLWNAFETCGVLTIHIPGEGDVWFADTAFVDDVNPFWNYNGEDPEFTLILPRGSQAHTWAKILGIEYRFEDGFHGEEIVIREEKDGHRYIQETGECVLTKYDGPGGEVVIPKNLELSLDSDYVYYMEKENSYRNIEREYKEKYGICYRDMDENIHYCIPMPSRKIGERAFSGCDAVISVEIPDSVTSIGNDAFSGCTALGRIFVPSSVVEIGRNAFDGCTNLVLAVREGSYAHRYAVSNGIAFVLC